MLVENVLDSFGDKKIDKVKVIKQKLVKGEMYEPDKMLSVSSIMYQ